MPSHFDSRYFKYFEHFNREEYFEAHEVLEDLWRECRGPEREFYQGVIQIAAAFVHVKNGNLAGAETLHGKAALNLAKYPSDYFGIHIPALLDRLWQGIKQPGVKPKPLEPNTLIKDAPPSL